MLKRPQTSKLPHKPETKPQPKVQTRPQTALEKSKLQTKPEIKPQPHPELEVKPKPDLNASFSIPCYIGGGVWKLVFEFLGAYEDLLNCRLVCKKWKTYIFQAAPLLLKEYLPILSSKTQSLCELMTGCPKFHYLEKFESELDWTLRYESFYEGYLKLIPQKSAFFNQLSDIAKLDSPKYNLKISLIAVMSFLMSKEELAERKKPLDWEYCQQRLNDINLMKSFQKMKPEHLTSEKIERFEAFMRSYPFVNGNKEKLLKDLNQHSLQVMYMVQWAMNLIYFKCGADSIGELGMIAVKESKIKKNMIKQEKVLTSVVNIESKKLNDVTANESELFKIV